MKSKALVVAILAAALVPAAAPGKGKPPSTGAGCKPQVAVVVKGTAADDGGSSLSLSVSGGNHWAKLLFANNTTTQATVTTSQTTKVTVAGKSGELTSIKKGDRVLVKYRICKGDLTGKTTAGTLADLLGSTPARHVIDLGPKSEDD